MPNQKADQLDYLVLVYKPDIDSILPDYIRFVRLEDNVRVPYLHSSKLEIRCNTIDKTTLLWYIFTQLFFGYI